MKKIIATWLIASLILSSCWKKEEIKNDNANEIKNVSINTLKKEPFFDEFKLVWKVVPFLETSVWSQTSWVIKNINFALGQKVKKWDILANIDLSSSTYWIGYNTANLAYLNTIDSYRYTQESAQKDLENAKIAFDNAKIAKENTYKVTEKQLELSKIQLDNIKKTKDNTINSTQESIKSAQIAVELAKKSLENSKINLENFKKTSEESTNWLYDNLKNVISSSMVSTDGLLTNIDSVLWISDLYKQNNDSYEIYLSAKNTSFKSRAELLFSETKWLYNAILSKKYDSSRTSLDEKSNKVVEMLEKSLDLCENMISVLNNSVVSTNFPQTQIDGINLSISKSQAWALQSQSQFISIKNSLNSLKTSVATNTITLENAVSIWETQLANAEQALTNLTSNNNSTIDNISWTETLTISQLENTNVSIKAQRDNVDNAMRSAQAQYDSLKAKINAQLNQSKIQLDSSKWQKDIAWVQLDNTKIVAPIDWYITQKNIEIWQLISPWFAAFVIWDISKLKIETEVNSDVSKFIKNWQEVTIKLWTHISTWSVTNISPDSDPQTKMYKIQIWISQINWNIKAWDFVEIWIKKQEWSESLISVPFSALIAWEQWSYGIFVVTENQTATLKKITIWRKTSSRAEVVEWLNENEKIIVTWALNLREWDKVNIIQ